MEKTKFTFLKLLGIMGIIAWTIAGLSIHYFEINHYYTKRHTVVENITNLGIYEGMAMCLKKETQQEKMQAISQQKDHSLKIRGNRSATCLAMGTVFRETEPKVGESHTKFHPLLATFMLLMTIAAGFVMRQGSEKEKTQGSILFAGLVIATVIFCYAHTLVGVILGAVLLVADEWRRSQKWFTVTNNFAVAGIIISALSPLGWAVMMGIAMRLAWRKESKELSISGLGLFGIYFAIFLLYAIIATEYANVSYGSGKMAADVMERTTGVPGITHSGGVASGIKVFMHYILYLGRQLFVVAVAYAAGSLAYRKLFKKEEVSLLNFGMATMIGFYFIFLFALVVSHFKGWTTPVVWTGFIAVLFAGRKYLMELWQKIRMAKIPFRLNFTVIAMIAAVLLLIAVYQFQVIRPIPIGWDAVRTYMNNAKMVDQFAMHLPGMGVNNMWTVIMSLGFVLWNSDAAAISYSSMPGLLFLLVFAGMLAVVIKKEYRDRIIPFTLLAFIQMPLFFFHMAQDDKIDMAVLFSSAIAMIGVYKFVKSNYDWRYGLLAGAAMALSVVVKATAIILLAPAIIMLTWYLYGLMGSMGALLILGGLVATKTHLISNYVAYTLIPIGLLFVLYVVVSRFADVKKTIANLMAYIVGFLITFLPINVHNMVVGEELSYSQARKGGAKITSEVNIRKSFPELEDVYVPETGDAANAELGRYIGFEKGHFKYSTFLVDVFTNRHQFGTYVTLSGVILVLIPLLAFALPFRRPLLTRGILAAQAVLYAKLSFFPGDALRMKLEGLGSVPSIIITLFLFAGPLVTTYCSVKKNKDAVIFTFAALVGWLIWLVGASGVIWYGISMFAAVFILLAVMLQQVFESRQRTVWLASVFALLLCTFTSVMGNEKMNTELFGFIDFKTGERTAKVSADNNLKIVRGIGEVMNREDESLIWAMGTSIKYHVDKNIARYFHDDTVNEFSYMTADILSEEMIDNQQLVTKRMYDLGFRYFLLDLNIHTIDRTPEKSLTKKFKRALEFTRENPWLQVIGTDVGKRARPRVIAYEILDPSITKEQLQQMRIAAGEGKSITMIKSKKD